MLYPSFDNLFLCQSFLESVQVVEDIDTANNLILKETVYSKIMSSIVTAVFKATIGLLVNKGRDKAAERLREGDVTDDKFRGLIVRELADVKTKLDGLSRKDLLASISFFEEGIEVLYEVFGKARSRSQGEEEPVQAACAKAFSLAEEMRNVELTDLDESATRTLAKAKKRFEEARREATRAFKNEALTTSDRILAMEYRVMATILETVDNPADAMAPCRVCIKELNCLPAVQNSLDVQLRKGIMAVKSFFGKDARGKIISSVCHVNRVVFDVTQAVGGKREPFWMWPAVDTGVGYVDVLSDGRIAEVLRKHDMEHCFLAPRSFGKGGKTEHKLNDPRGIAVNSKGQFIICDNGDKNVKVFDRRGQFINHFSFPGDDDQDGIWHQWCDVASDMNDNIYVLVELFKRVRSEYFVYKFSYSWELLLKFSVKLEILCSYYGLTVDSRGNVLFHDSHVIFVHGNDGQFVRSFGRGLFCVVLDLTCASDGRVIVLDLSDKVHVFSEQGDHLSMFQVQQWSPLCRIAFHNSSEHVILAGKKHDCLYVEMYTKDGEFLRSTQIGVRNVSFLLRGVAVTTEGHISVVVCTEQGERKVLIV